MNKKQLIVLAIGILAVAACFLYPPWKDPQPESASRASEYVQYGWFWDPPNFLVSGGFPGGPRREYATAQSLDWNRLLLQAGIVFAISTAAVFAVKTAKNIGEKLDN